MAGKSEMVQLLNQWMDPRGIVNRAFDNPSEAERERPPFWRYWLALPPYGKVGLFMSGWYGPPLAKRVARRSTVAEFDAALDRIAAFEQTLAADGALILKFWIDLSKRAQKRASRSSRRTRSPAGASQEQWKQHRQYDRWTAAAERGIQRTSVGHAPWFIIDGGDARYRNLAVTTEIRDALFRRLDSGASSMPARKRRRVTTPITATAAAPPANLVSRVDRSARCST